MRKFEFVKRYNETRKLVDKNGDVIEWKLPARSTAKSAGYDFFAPERVEIPPYKIGDNPVMIKTGIKVLMPDDEYLMLVNRSSNPKKKKLVIPNSVGIVDADYYGNPDNDGEMMFAFYNLSNEIVVIEAGEKLGQGIFCKYGKTDDDKAEGKRIGGWGSTNA